jgi:transcriptional regulator with XRE-family HTH domain
LFNNPIPHRLKQARKRAGISQKNLGLLIGMYEKDRHTPDINTLRKIADALGVPLNYFFCDDDSTAELSIEIAKLSEDKKEQLLKMIKQLSDE